MNRNPQKRSLGSWIFRLFGLILSIGMVFSLLPAPIHAAEFEDEGTSTVAELEPQENQVRLEEKSTDPTTILQADPEQTGAVLTAKNVRASNEGFNIELSALSSAKKTTTQLEEPMDIVLVLDTSGTMSVQFGQGMRRLQGMQRAVNQFLNEVEQSNQLSSQSRDPSQVGIITFGDEAYLDLPLTSDLEQARKVIANLKPFGVTYTDKAFTQAKNLIQTVNENDKRRKVVIFFSDGVPSNGYGFTRSIADSAVSSAYQIKNEYSGIVYSIGIFNTADPDASILLPEDPKRDNENRFMQAVSSNFPQAESYSVKGELGLRRSYRYYMSAQDPDSLLNVFEVIFESMAVESTYPIETNPEDPGMSGYTTMKDQMGDWMEVCSDPLLLYQGQQHQPIRAERNGNTTTYTYAGLVEGNILTGPKIYDLESTVRVQITHNQDQRGDEVFFQFPAALLPMTYFRQESSGQLETTPDLPISLQYKIRLKAAMQNTLDHTAIDSSAAQWIQEHEEEDQIRFYANAFEKQGNQIQSLATASYRPASLAAPISDNGSSAVNIPAYYEIDKTNNVTQSAPYRQIGEMQNGIRQIQYGNNGVLVYGVNTDLDLYKFVQADRTLIVPNQDFRFLITLTDVNGKPWNGVLKAAKLTEQSPETYVPMNPIQIKDGQGSFTLKNLNNS